MTNRRRLMRATLLTVAGVQAAGCIEVPFWEGSTEWHGPRDFRPLVGSSQSDKPIRPGAASRHGVEALLGTPPLVSDDGAAIGYTLGTVSGLRIFPPLFFLPADAEAHAYVLRLCFGPDGRLSRYTLYRKDREINNGLICYTGLPNGEAVAELNSTGPRLYPTGDVSRRAVPATRP